MGILAQWMEGEGLPSLSYLREERTKEEPLFFLPSGPLKGTSRGHLEPNMERASQLGPPQFGPGGTVNFTVY